MKKIAAFLIFALTLVVGPLNASDDILTGTVLRAKGATFIEVGENFEPLKAGQLVTEGNKLSTEKGSLFVQMADKSIINMGPWTELVIKSQKVDDDGRDVVFRLFSGWFKAVVNKVKGKSGYKVDTGMLVVAVKGTEFSVESEEGEMGNVVVREGVVEMAAGDKKTLVQEEEGAFVTDKEFIPAKEMDGAALGDLEKEWKTVRSVKTKRNALMRKHRRRGKVELKKLLGRLDTEKVFQAAMLADAALKAAHMQKLAAREILRKAEREKERKKKKKKRKSSFWFYYNKTTY